MTYASFIKCKYKYSFIKTFNMLKKSIIYHFFFFYTKCTCRYEVYEIYELIEQPSPIGIIYKGKEQFGQVVNW